MIYPTKAFNEMQAQFPMDSHVNIMKRLGYKEIEGTHHKLWYNPDTDRWGKSWVRWGSYGKQLDDAIFFGTGYKKDAQGELWFDYEEER